MRRLGLLAAATLGVATTVQACAAVLGIEEFHKVDARRGGGTDLGDADIASGDAAVADGGSPYPGDACDLALPNTGVTSFDSNVSLMTAGGGHTCVVLESGGKVKCWGRNVDGELGNGSNKPSPTPVDVKQVQHVVSISAGAHHTCVSGDSVIACWGSNSSGQLGIADRTSSNEPIAVALTAANVVAAADEHTCVRATDSSLWCWGANAAGQFGDGTRTSSSKPVKAKLSGAVSGAVAGSASGGHSCVVMAGGAVACTGDNTFGQLGNDTQTSATVPVVVKDVMVDNVDLGQSFSCGLLNDGSISCWGENDRGQLGNGMAELSTKPTGVFGITTAKAVAAGHSHACALLADKTVKCWGANESGQLGTGVAPMGLVPAPVCGIDSAAQIAAGTAHTCALLEDRRTVKCWGSNSDGQRGATAP